MNQRHPAVASRTTRSSFGAPRLLPVMLAILAAFPAGAVTPVTVTRPAVPAPSAVPKPNAGWVVSTSAANSPSTLVTSPITTAGGASLTINQTSPSAVYSWASFDIGASSSVTFNYPSATSSSLNRVTGSTTPSAIYGKLTSQFTAANGTQQVGGSIYLINANGILFGKTAQVNTGALIASTLDLQNADFYSGLSQSITSTNYTFGPFDASGATAASLLPGGSNFVLVDPGAQITTTSGGRVFLFANNVVQNAGTITTPNGQTVLAAGDQVYLNLPTNEVMYASEVNSAIPAVNGLLVEVGTGAGSVANLQGGVINTPTGNTTLVGMAVNQSGRINATTSVAQDGSVFLLARGSAQTQAVPVVTKEATLGGTLTLGAGSVIDIEPDATVDAKGQQATSNATASFTPSLVELSGKTIEMQSGAAIVAHGGVVDARAESTPYYELNSDAHPAPYNYAALTGDDARLAIDANATIDVSGTTDATVSAARNFVTTALLGASDLADAPLQRTGPVYRSELTFDVRSPVPILGSTASYVAAIEKTATEQLAVGGKVSLQSTGAVVTNASSSLNVSGGVVNYTAATVSPSELLGSDGKLYTFNQAPAGLTYTGILGAPTGQLDRWGVVPSYSPSQVSSGFVTPGYVAGQAGGTLSIVSPVAVLDGQIQAGVTQGVRQTAGLDSLATLATLNLGARTNGSNAFGSDGFISAGLGNLDLVAAPGASNAVFWSDPLNAALPASSRIAASTLDASGVGHIAITSNGQVSLQPGADLDLPASASVDVAAGGAIDIEADVRSAGGTVAATTRPVNGVGVAGSLTLGASNSIDVAATWVNRATDGATVRASTAGGSVTLSSGAGLEVQDSSTIDVSGAATVGVDGKVAATAAGSVTLQSGMSLLDNDPRAPIHVGGRIVAHSLAGGGALTLGADAVTIVAGTVPGGIADGAAIGSLVLSNQFFDQSAFTRYNIDAVSSLQLVGGATLQPQASNWIPSPDAATMPTGTQPSSFMGLGALPVAQRAPVSVTLSAASLQGNAKGTLTVAPGAAITVDPSASVTLNAGVDLNIGGKVVAPGGNVVVSLVGSAQTPPVAGTLTLGQGAVIDVSGVAVLQPQTGALPTGQVLAGGNVSLGISQSAGLTPIVIAPGAVIDADGASATLGVTTTGAQGAVGVTAQTVSSAGGSISIAAADGGVLAGNLHAVGGDASVSGGSFNLGSATTIVVQQAAVASSTPVDGIVSVSAQSLEHNFSDASLQAVQQVRFASDVDLEMAGNLKIDVPVLSAAPNVSSVKLSGASTLQVGASYQRFPTTAGAVGGAARLSLDGGLVELYGQQVVQGFGNVGVTSASDLRLQSLSGSSGLQGDFAVQGALTLAAAQVVPTTASQYVIDAPGQRVAIVGGNAATASPLSAGGSLTINAADIAIGDATDATQVGVVRAPFGSLTLNATDGIAINGGSVLSVSGTGLTVPYGQTTGGTNWSYAGEPVTAPVAKSIALNAPGGAIVVASGSTIDLSGGGKLVAREFVPGVGGSKDIFAGAAGGAFAIVPTAGSYAAQDLDILQFQPDTSGKSPTLQLGREIVLGGGGPVPAGTYAVMPAEYATLAGAFLVTPTTSSAPLALGAAVRQTDSSVLMGGRFVEAGTGFGNSTTQSFKVQTSAQALAYSEIDQANANAYFSAQAAASGSAAPALPTDAGALAIAASQLSLKGSTLFRLPTVTTGTGSTTTTTSVGRGGQLDISADDIQVGGTAAAGVLSLSAADLNATGAALIVLGGHADASTGQLAVAASSVVIDNAGAALKINDLVLAANQSVTLAPGAAIEAPASTGAPQAAAPLLTLAGDGALLRVSTDASAASVRTGAQGLGGILNVGAGATLSGGSITAEGTQTNVIASDATLKAQAVTLGAGRIAVGSVDAGTAGADTLLLTPTLASQVAGVDALTLRSATSLDLYGSVTLGNASLQSLTLDTGSIAVIGSGATATVQAGGVTLKNTTGNIAAAGAGDNTLRIEALSGGTTTGTGQVQVGPGAVAISGAGSVALAAARDVVLGDTAALSTAGDLGITAASLQATRGAGASLSAGGNFTLDSTETTSTASAGSGAQVRIAAQAIAQDGQIALPSGQLALNATGAGDAVSFGATSRTDLSGRSSQIDGITVATPGGTLNVLAASGNVRIDAGALVDVSAPAAGAHAGSITISAPTGTVALQGRLAGSAGDGQGGGSLSIDSASALDLTALAATIAALPDNFGASLSVRNRDGDQQLAAGTRLAAQDISLSADTGTLAIAGQLDASGASGTGIVLAGGKALDIDAGATIAAHSTGSSGSRVQLLSGNLQLQGDGSFAGSQGSVDFNGGSIDTSAAAGGANGVVLVRAQRGADGTGVAIGGSGGTTIAGASQVEIESVRQYAATAVDATLIAKVVADNQALGANAAAVLSRVGTLIGQPASALQLRSGVEIDSAGDLAMAGTSANGGWNLTTFSANGAAQAQASGAPMDLTLRAAGNLVVTGSISDGFLPSGTVPTTAAAASKITPAAVVAQAGGSYLPGANIALVGGADLGAADVMRTVASADGGDVTIGATGKNVLVRTTTGDIAIAAGRDVTLLNTQAAVYTTGTPVATLPGYVGNLLPNGAYLRSGTASQSPFLAGGGSLDVVAGRDIVGVDPTLASVQSESAWAWRASDRTTNGQPMWWNRYDLFQQGFATFGGGNVTADAGRDLVNATFSAAASGYVARDANGAATGSVSFGGGDLAVQAGRDIVGGGVLAAGSTGSVQAGRDITAGTEPFALQVLYGNTALDVGALGNLELGLVSAFAMTPGSNQYLAPLPSNDFPYLMGLTPQATLKVLAASGDLAYDSATPLDTPVSGPEPATVPDRIIPDVASFSAPNGSVTVNTLVQMPAGTTRLSLLAQQDLTISAIGVGGTDARAAAPTLLAGTDPLVDPLDEFDTSYKPVDTGARSPMELVANTGDVTITRGVRSTDPMRLIAGRDVVLGPSPFNISFQGITIQHQDADEVSLIQAGRDILFSNDSQFGSGGVSLYGPGNLLVLAGRNIDLSTSGGVRAVGNRQNDNLPAASGDVTMASGVSLANGDYTQATAWYFPLLGGTGIAGNAPDLVAQLTAIKAGQALPAPGSSAAQQFAALSIADQVTQVKALVGDAVFNAALLADAQRRAGDVKLALSDAQASFAKLDASAQASVLGAALANAWVATVPASQQQAQVLAMATAAKSPYVAQLQQFVVAQGGPAAAATDAGQALAAFEAMAPERQALFTNLVLVDVIRTAGRAASKLSGAAQTAAYAPAYAALDTVFPVAGATGNIEMGASQVETLQDSNITVLAPRGSVDVGTLVPSQNPKPASALGLVTAAGGHLSVVVSDSVNVDQSRVFTVGLGDLLMWASNGSLDAGRGGKTVVGAPAPVYRLNAAGQFVVDLSGSFSGSGIAVLNAASDLDLYAPKGTIDAGDAGIKSLGNAYFGAAAFVGADNLSVGGVSVGAPPPASTGGGTAGLAAVASNASAATTVNAGDSEEEKERKRRKRLNLVLDFLGFGDGSSKP